jgi:PhnB protein
MPGGDMAAPSPDAGVHASTTWFTADADAAVARAVAAGATLSSPVADQFHGDRVGVLRDPFGHRWVIATHVTDVTDEDQQSRLTTMMTSTPT